MRTSILKFCKNIVQPITSPNTKEVKISRSEPGDAGSACELGPVVEDATNSGATITIFYNF